MRPIQFVTLGDDVTRLPESLAEDLLATDPVADVGPLRIRCLT